MKPARLHIVAALFVAGAVAMPVVAHHSGAMFDNTKTVELTGTVKEFQWTNPHIWIQIERQNTGGAKEEWSVEGGSPNSLSRNGWRKTTFAPGTAVSIRVNPMRDGSHAGNFVGAKFADGKTIGRWE
jgi:hypothetical protein